MDYRVMTAAFGIALVDIVLSGDNALVIGAAASRLRGPKRIIALLWGGLGAIVLRLLLASLTTVLLLVPYLRFAGGVLIFAVAVRLLWPESGGHKGQARDKMLPAIMTIILADITMSLDNVLAVGGLADGNIPLLVAGNAFSMVVLFIGSSLVALLVERLAWLMDVAALILAWTAANLVLEDPVTGRFVHLDDREQLVVHFGFLALILLVDLLIRAIKRHSARPVLHADAGAAAHVASNSAHGEDAGALTPVATAERRESAPTTSDAQE
ncbi:MAG: hypothetical protein OJF49_002670 [Ktedonobacterales bacterium]|jgi:YjbE family integral membrane protein|nr:MAG: hypothetical protein OJF49_002670 [Ktedonobacterales bacterium]